MIECPNCRGPIKDTDNNEINELINNLSEKELVIYDTIPNSYNTYFDLFDIYIFFILIFKYLCKF